MAGEQQQSVTAPDFGIVFGIATVVFLGFFTSPIWYSAAFGEANYTPQPQIAEAAGDECIMDRDLIRVEHMELLDDWRDETVRETKRMRVDTARGGRFREKSLTKTCLGCHTEPENFCDVCHDYAGEDPYCWDCHVDANTERDMRQAREETEQ